jgi:hypothetical protein
VPCRGLFSRDAGLLDGGDVVDLAFAVCTFGDLHWGQLGQRSRWMEGREGRRMLLGKMGEVVRTGVVSSALQRRMCG